MRIRTTFGCSEQEQALKRFLDSIIEREQPEATSINLDAFVFELATNPRAFEDFVLLEHYTYKYTYFVLLLKHFPSHRDALIQTVLNHTPLKALIFSNPVALLNSIHRNVPDIVEIFYNSILSADSSLILFIEHMMYESFLPWRDMNEAYKIKFLDAMLKHPEKLLKHIDNHHNVILHANSLDNFTKNQTLKQRINQFVALFLKNRDFLIKNIVTIGCLKNITFRFPYHAAFVLNIFVNERKLDILSKENDSYIEQETNKLVEIILKFSQYKSPIFEILVNYPNHLYRIWSDNEQIFNGYITTMIQQENVDLLSRLASISTKGFNNKTPELLINAALKFDRVFQSLNINDSFIFSNFRPQRSQNSEAHIQLANRIVNRLICNIENFKKLNNFNDILVLLSIVDNSLAKQLIKVICEKGRLFFLIIKNDEQISILRRFCQHNSISDYPTVLDKKRAEIRVNARFNRCAMVLRQAKRQDGNLISRFPSDILAKICVFAYNKESSIVDEATAFTLIEQPRPQQG